MPSLSRQIHVPVVLAVLSERIRVIMRDLGRDLNQAVRSFFWCLWVSKKDLPARLNEVRQRLVARREENVDSITVVEWEYRRHSALFRHGENCVRRILKRGNVFGFGIDWKGRRRSYHEQLALARWYADTSRPELAQKLLDGYHPYGITHVERAALELVTAIARFREGKQPLHFVVQDAVRSHRSGRLWDKDPNRAKASADFTLIQLSLGALLMQVAEKWKGDITQKTAPFLNRDGERTRMLAVDYLLGGFELARDHNHHILPKAREVLARHGLLGA